MDDHQKILSETLDEFKSTIKPKLILCFDSLDDAVSDLVSNTNSEKLQNRYFDRALEIKSQKNELLNIFMSSLDRVFELFTSGNYDFFIKDDSEKSQLKLNSLSLVEDTILDEYLACSNLVSKTEINCNNNLYGIEQRFAKLVSKDSLKIKHLPISPEVLVDAYQQSVNSIKTKIDLDMHFRLLMYILFDRSVLGSMNEIYHHINNYLASKGIIETISYGVGANHSPQENSELIEEKFDSLNETVPTISPDQQESLSTEETTLSEDIDQSYQLISKLLQNNLQKLGNTDFTNSSNTSEPSDTSENKMPQFELPVDYGQGEGEGENQTANIDSMIKALSSIQSASYGGATKTIDFANSNKTPDTIKTEFIQELSIANKDSAIANDDMEAIDLIVLLFKYIVDDRNLPDAIQVILSHLQIPYLKIAIQDKKLFADKKHPARELLNNISLASVGWSEETDGDKSFINKIHELANEILAIETYEEDYFLNLIEEFDTFIENIQIRLKNTEEKANEQLLKKEKLVQAKKSAADILISKMTNKQMPVLFKDILLGSWLYIMVLTETKYSRISDEYDDRIDFIDTLIKSAKVDENHIITDIQIKSLTTKYYQGLKLVTFDKKEIYKKLVALKKSLVRIHLNPRNDSTLSETESQEIIDLAEIQDHQLGVVSYIKEEEELSAVHEEIEIDQDHLSIAKSLTVGTWLEFISDDFTTNRAKLSWISPITGRYLFVDANGLKYDDLTLQSIALDLASNAINIIEDTPLFDRAFTTIANDLQAKSA